MLGRKGNFTFNYVWSFILGCKNSFLPFLECSHLLLNHGAQVKVKNVQGWSPLAEAISYGDRPTSKLFVYYN